MICPDKVTTAQWLAVHDAAHRVGLRSNVTLMFGHADTPRSWARHLLRAREQQQRSGGFTEFVPLPFVPDGGADLPAGPRAPRADLPRDAARARGRAAGAASWITNVQASWVKLGPEGTREALAAGVNDLGGTLMNESISRSAGAEYGQELPPERMEELIRSAGRVPRQRTTLYGDAAGGARARVVRRLAARGAGQPAREGRGPRRAAAARATGPASGGRRTVGARPRPEARACSYAAHRGLRRSPSRRALPRRVRRGRARARRSPRTRGGVSRRSRCTPSGSSPAAKNAFDPERLGDDERPRLRPPERRLAPALPSQDGDERERALRDLVGRRRGAGRRASPQAPRSRDRGGRAAG